MFIKCLFNNGSRIIKTSTDGVNWESFSGDVIFSKLLYANDTYIGLQISGGMSIVYVSKDLHSWEYNDIPYLSDIYCAGDRFFYSHRYTDYNQDKIFTSTDGKNWVEIFSNNTPDRQYVKPNIKFYNNTW